MHAGSPPYNTLTEAFGLAVLGDPILFQKTEKVPSIFISRYATKVITEKRIA
jgi:hypothetical protein